jgi:hypothetical protein
MCDATALLAISAIASIAGTGVGYVTNQANVKAQREYQEFIYEQNKAITASSLVNQYAAINERQIEEQKKASQEISEIVRQARQAKATSYVSSLEAGVAGLSVDALLDDYTRKESEFITRTQEQQRAVMSQLQREKTGLGFDAYSRIIGATPQPLQGPSIFAAGLSMLGTAAGALGTEIPENSNTLFGKMFSSSGGSSGAPSV